MTVVIGGIKKKMCTGKLPTSNYTVMHGTHKERDYYNIGTSKKINIRIFLRLLFPLDSRLATLVRIVRCQSILQVLDVTY